MKTQIIFILLLLYYNCIESTEIVNCKYRHETKTSIWLFCRNSTESDCKSELLLNPNNEMALNIKSIKTVHCTGSHLNEALLSRFNKLRKLDVSSYGLVTLAVSDENRANLGSLKKLIASNNRLTELRQNYLAPMVALEEVDLSINNINFVEKFISKKLKLINLSQNHIFTLPDDTFSELFSLENLDLSFNYIEIISDQLLINNKKLEFLSLQNNRIRYFGCRRTFTRINTVNVANNNQRMNTLELLQSLGTEHLWSLNLTGIQLGDRSIDVITSKFGKVNYIGISYELLSCQCLRMIDERMRNHDPSIRNLIKNCKLNQQWIGTEVNPIENSVTESFTVEYPKIPPNTTIPYELETETVSSTLSTEPIAIVHETTTDGVNATTEPVTFFKIVESTRSSEPVTESNLQSTDDKFNYVQLAICIVGVLVVLGAGVVVWFCCRRKPKVEMKVELQPSKEENIYEIVRFRPNDDFS